MFTSTSLPKITVLRTHCKNNSLWLRARVVHRHETSTPLPSPALCFCPISLDSFFYIRKVVVVAGRFFKELKQQSYLEGMGQHDLSWYTLCNSPMQFSLCNSPMHSGYTQRQWTLLENAIAHFNIYVGANIWLTSQYLRFTAKYCHSWWCP